MTFPVKTAEATYSVELLHPYSVATLNRYGAVCVFSASKGEYTNHDTLELALQQAEHLASKGWRGLWIEQKVLGPRTRP